jgi:predicted O-methyltransferase YrrM
MIAKFGYDSFTTFKAGMSLDLIKNTTETFDFIFLDGDHFGGTVYQEIPAALNILNPNGAILLHYYFPKMKPLWSNGLLVEGPYLGTDRLIQEGANIKVIPLGDLP